METKNRGKEKRKKARKRGKKAEKFLQARSLSRLSHFALVATAKSGDGISDFK